MSGRPKSGSKAAPGNLQVTEKVRDIKQKQEKWLRQRQNSLDRQKNSKPSPTGGVSRLGSRSASSIKASGSPRNEDNESPKPAARINPNLRKTYCKTTSTAAVKEQHATLGDADLEGKASSASAPDCFLDPYSPSPLDTGRSDAISTLSIPDSLRSGPISPEQFDDLADQIVSRVRKQLNLTSGVEEQRSLDVRGQGDGGNGGTDSESRSEQLNTSECGLDSQRCQKCSKIMAPPNHSPMLVIPCGHTYCLQCASGHAQCPGCQCAVQSLTCNIMLQQIIVDYLKRHQGQPAENTGKVYNASNYEAKVLTTDDYNNIIVRCEVLEQEVDCIADNIRQVDIQLEKEEKQMRNIDNEEARIEMEIRELERTLSDLQKHKDDYYKKIQHLQTQKEAEKKRQQMTRQTLRDLRKQIEKARRHPDGDV